MSSYLAFRYIEREGMDFYPGLHHENIPLPDGKNFTYVRTAAEIDEINILKASFLAMQRAVEQLKIVPQHLLIDGNRFTPYKIPYTTVVKGDAKFMSIAAASILAKTYRDDYMLGISKEFPQYDWQKNKGYPTPKHRAAIREHGATCHHRMTFNLTGEDPQLSLQFGE